MENKITPFLKDFFFKFNSTFLSGHLEDRLKYHKSFSELCLNLRKKIVFYVLSFGVFCIFLSQIPTFFKGTLNAFLTNQNTWNTIGQISVWGMLFLGVLYLTKFMESGLLRDVDFFITRIQVATRYLLRPSIELHYENLNTAHLLKFLFAIFAIIPLIVLYQALSVFLSVWILIPIFLNAMTFLAIGLLQNKNVHYSKKTKDHYQKDVKFFLSIERFLERIRALAFDAVIKKQILSFSENNSFLYLKIFENDVMISGIKYCSVFLFFAVNSVLFLMTIQAQGTVNFLSVIMISVLISYYFLATLKIFEFREGAGEVFRFFKHMDDLNSRLEPIDSTNNDEDNQNIISFENASFVKNNQVVMHQINQHLKQNLLIAVIGSTHEERSNYLSASAGNLQQIGGKVYRPSNFEFLSKHPILFDGSIRENIVQFNDYDQHHYQEVLKACALNKEIELLSANDLTKIDQHGTNFSASFLRKITIARIVYAKSPVNFFDDPFSELSQQDAAKIFFEAFQTLLAGTTRIFCTDRTEYAALSDDIVLCKGGKIAEQGSHVALLSQNDLYARLFYAGAENRRFEILQNYAKQETSEFISPMRQHPLLQGVVQTQAQAFVFGEQLFEKFKQKIDKISYFMKMFFPVFVTKNFYAFFTFLTLSIWAAIYSFYFVFQNLHLNAAAKTSVLFFCFSVIACVSFSVMLIFYKNVYSTCAYIIENVSKFYFASFITQGAYSSSTGTTLANQGMIAESHFDWRKEHILAVTGKFYNQLLNFAIIGLFCLTLIMFASTLSLKLFTVGMFCAVVIVFFIHSIIQTKLFYDEEDSKQLNQKFQQVTCQFFDSFHETQSKTMRAYLLEKVHAKIYGLYFSHFVSPKKNISLFKMLGFHSLRYNYQIIETMISTIKSEPHGFRPKVLPLSWPSNGVIQFQDVRFNSDQDILNTFTISPNSRFMYVVNTNSKKSVLIEKLRASSSVVSGEMRIDGEDLSLISPIELRRRIGYVAQSSFIPFLTIRDHLDPYGYYDDADMWEVLNKVGLSQHVALFKQGLSTKMEQIPQEMHWSGEVLLFSLARCVLNQNKIICIDYIEASEDVENKICSIIESECRNCTVIFAGENKTFKNICTMVYPESEDESSSSILRNGNNAMGVTNNEEPESTFPFAN